MKDGNFIIRASDANFWEKMEKKLSIPKLGLVCKGGQNCACLKCTERIMLFMHGYTLRVSIALEMYGVCYFVRYGLVVEMM